MCECHSNEMRESLTVLEHLLLVSLSFHLTYPTLYCYMLFHSLILSLWFYLYLCKRNVTSLTWHIKISYSGTCVSLLFHMIQAANELNSEERATINHFLCLTPYAKYRATKNKNAIFFFTLMDIKSGAVPWSSWQRLLSLVLRWAIHFFSPKIQA